MWISGWTYIFRYLFKICRKKSLSEWKQCTQLNRQSQLSRNEDKDNDINDTNKFWPHIEYLLIKEVLRGAKHSISFYRKLSRIIKMLIEPREIWRYILNRNNVTGCFEQGKYETLFWIGDLWTNILKRRNVNRYFKKKNCEHILSKRNVNLYLEREHCEPIFWKKKNCEHVLSNRNVNYIWKGSNIWKGSIFNRYFEKRKIVNTFWVIGMWTYIWKGSIVNRYFEKRKIVNTFWVIGCEPIFGKGVLWTDISKKEQLWTHFE